MTKLFTPTKSQVVVNILVLAVSLVLTDKIPNFAQKLFPEQDWVKYAAYAAIVLVALALLVLIAAVYLHDTIAELTLERGEVAKERGEVATERSALIESRKDERIREAIPFHIVVVSREDTLVIDDNGDGTLDWVFSIKVNDAEKCQSLDLQILSECFELLEPGGEKKYAGNIKITRIVVAGNEVRRPHGYYRTHEIRHPDDISAQKRPMEFGILSVPLNYEEIRLASVSKVTITMVMKGTFRDATSQAGDYFLVDIPQLTESLKVEIRTASAGSEVQSNLSEDKLSVRMGYGGTLDRAEMFHQLEKIKQRAGALVWQSAFPKLGYHYRLSFRIVRGENGASSIHES